MTGAMNRFVASGLRDRRQSSGRPGGGLLPRFKDESALDGGMINYFHTPSVRKDHIARVHVQEMDSIILHSNKYSLHQSHGILPGQWCNIWRHGNFEFLRRSLRLGAHAAPAEWQDLSHCPNGAGFSVHRIPLRPTAWPRHHRIAGGRRPAKLGGPLAQRHEGRGRTSGVSGIQISFGSGSDYQNWITRVDSSSVRRGRDAQTDQGPGLSLQRGRALSSAEFGISCAVTQTKQLLQRGRACSRMDGICRFRLARFFYVGVCEKIGASIYQRRPFGPGSFPARMFTLTDEPFRRARGPILLTIAEIPPDQQSVVNVKSPGFLRFLRFTNEIEHRNWCLSTTHTNQLN